MKIVYRNSQGGIQAGVESADGSLQVGAVVAADVTLGRYVR